MLGDILQRGADTAGIKAWLGTHDPALWQRLCDEATGQGRDPGDIIHTAIAQFAQRADEEAWAMLISRMRGAEDPGRALVLTKLRWWLDSLADRATPSGQEGSQ